MKISIIPPRQISYIKILLRTKKFFKNMKIKTVIEDETKSYYLFFRKGNIQIQLLKNDINVIHEIQKYLEYTFKNYYIGIPEEYFEVFELKHVRKVKM